MNAQLNQNRTEAERFLALLDEGAETFTFQTFDDNKDRSDGFLARVLHGSLDEHWDELCRLSEEGAGVFVTVNSTDGQGRRLENMVSIRCVFQEADRPGTPEPPLEPQIVVESSPMKFHRYLLVDPPVDLTCPTDTLSPGGDVAAQRSRHSQRSRPAVEFEGVMQRMVEEYGSDPNATDLSRVLRLPGFPHQKDPATPHMVHVVQESGAQPYRWEQILEALPPLPAREPVAAPPGRGIAEPIRAAAMLQHLDSDREYGEWLAVGMALHHASGGAADGLELWDRWSANGDLYRCGECASKWHSFGRYAGKPVTFGSLVDMATEDGWSPDKELPWMLQEARMAVQGLADRLQENSSLVTSGAVIEALKIIRVHDYAEYEAIRMEIKERCGNRVRIAFLDEATRGERANEPEDNATTRIVGLIEESAELFHDEHGECYATTDPTDTAPAQTWKLTGSGFKEWVIGISWRSLRVAISDTVWNSVKCACAAIATHDGPERATAMRIASLTDQRIAIDLGRPDWKVVVVDPEGWRLSDTGSLPVRLWRVKDMMSLPEPLANGDLDLLWRHVNIHPDDRLLVKAWLLESLRPDTPFPILEISGGQGSAKSTTQRRLRRLIDPHRVLLRGKPKNREDIFVAGSNAWMVSFENVSGLSAEMQDALCILSTGGGHAGRQLYTDAEEHAVEVKRPAIMNGITANATRPDLIDRVIHLDLDPIPPRERKTEAEMEAAFEEDYPAIFTGMLQELSNALRALPEIQLDERPRMADFALLGEAMLSEEHQGLFVERFKDNQRESMLRVLEGSPVAMGVKTMVESGRELSEETMTAAYEAVEDYRPESHDTPWPKSPRGFGDALRRYAPALALVGIKITEHGRERDGRKVSIVRNRSRPGADSPWRMAI